jgi:hypothetical protein
MSVPFRKRNLAQGEAAEKEFITLRGDNFVRRANSLEDMNEHWDVLDKEFGRVDVKSGKRSSHKGKVDYTIWWELRTVKRPPNWQPQFGWGVPNGIERLIAVRSKDAFYLIKPEDIIEDLRAKCSFDRIGHFRLMTRPNRGDLITTLPFDYVIEHARHKVEVVDVV